MFSTLQRILGNIKVVASGKYVSIEGLPTRGYMNDIYALWKTSKIQDQMFSRVTRNSVTFHEFFLPDVLYTLETIVAKPRRGAATNYRVLKKVVEKLKTETWLKRTYMKLPDILDFMQVQKLKWKLLDHQKNFLRQYNEVIPKYGLHGMLLAAVPGSGKTFTGIALSVCVKADVTICIVPKNAVDTVWAATIEEVFKVPVTLWKSTGNEPLTPGKAFYVCHYEQLEDLVHFFRSYRPLNPVVILDESHNFNDMSALRVNLFLELCTKVLHAKHVIHASGTPIKAIGAEAVPMLVAIDPLFDDEDIQERFKKIYGKSASRAVDILRNRLGLLTFKVEKDQVIKNEVEVITKNVEIPNGQAYTLDVIKEDMRIFVMQRVEFYQKNFHVFQGHYDRSLAIYERVLPHRPPQTIQHYEEYKHYIRIISQGFDPRTMREMAMFCNKFELEEIVPTLPSGLKEEFKNARSVIKYVDLKIRGEALGRVLGKKRAECHVQMVPFAGLEEEIDIARKKTVIFTSYVEVVDAVNDYLKKKGYNPAVVYGATNKDLKAIVDRFEKDEDVNPLIATFQSLSTAVPLVMASTGILLNSPFRSFEYDQATARIDRLNQDGPVTFVNVFLNTGDRPNISTRSGDIMEWSRASVDAIMGKDSSVDDIALETISLEEIANEIEQETPVGEHGWLQW